MTGLSEGFICFGVHFKFKRSPRAINRIDYEDGAAAEGPV